MPDTATNHRMLHTMIRVKDLDKSLAFYTGPMGMQLLRKREVPEGKYTFHTEYAGQPFSQEFYISPGEQTATTFDATQVIAGAVAAPNTSRPQVAMTRTLASRIGVRFIGYPWMAAARISAMPRNTAARTTATAVLRFSSSSRPKEKGVVLSMTR